jgi:hypothetical protein
VWRPTVTFHLMLALTRTRWTAAPPWWSSAPRHGVGVVTVSLCQRIVPERCAGGPTASTSRSTTAGLDSYGAPAAPSGRGATPHLPRERSTVLRLVSSGDIPDGTPLMLRPTTEVTPEVRAAIEAWVNQDPRRGRARWYNDRRQPLAWEYDGGRYRPTEIVRRVLADAAGVQHSPRGPAWWVLEDGRDLPTVAGVPGLPERPAGTRRRRQTASRLLLGRPQGDPRPAGNARS